MAKQSCCVVLPADALKAVIAMAQRPMSLGLMPENPMILPPFARHRYQPLLAVVEEGGGLLARSLMLQITIE
jgi:hypothetical protein